MATPLFSKDSALVALACDRTPENALFFDILEKKLFSRFGSLDEATRLATQNEFAQRNVSAALWELGRGYTGKTPTSILMEDVRAVQLQLWRFAELAYMCDTQQSVIGGIVKNGVQPWVCADAMEPGPGSTVATMGQPGATCITKFLYGDQGVGSTAIYARYIHLLASCDTKTQSYTEIERFRVRQCKTVVTPQELIVIPKNERTGRVITPQNGIDLLVQKELAYRMTSALRRAFGLDLGTQPGLNSELARRGSIDGSVATLDLQAASDSITVNTVKLLFKGHPLLGQLSLEVWVAIQRSRYRPRYSPLSRASHQNDVVDAEVCRLAMISSSMTLLQSTAQSYLAISASRSTSTNPSGLIVLAPLLVSGRAVVVTSKMAVILHHSA